MRMFNVYGPGQNMKNLKQGMVSIYLSQALRKKHIVVKGSINRFRDFIYINDVVDIWYECTLNKVSNISLNIGSGIKTSVKSLLNILEKELGITYSVTKNTLGDQNGIYADIRNLKKICKKKICKYTKWFKEFINYEKKSIMNYIYIFQIKKYFTIDEL